MSDPTFMADPTRLVIAAIVGIALLLALIIKFKLHPVLSMMVSALAIGIGAGMPLDLVADTVTKGVGTTLQNIALLIGLGSMFGQILEESGGAKKIAQTFIDTFGQGHSSWALGITGLVIGTTVFFEAGVVVLIPLAFSVASQTKKSTLYYGIALLAGLAAGYAFVPPSAGSVLVAGTLGVDLGTMILVGIPTAFIAMAIAGVIWGRNVDSRIFTDVPEHFTSAEGASDEKGASLLWHGACHRAHAALSDFAGHVVLLYPHARRARLDPCLPGQAVRRFDARHSRCDVSAGCAPRLFRRRAQGPARPFA